MSIEFATEPSSKTVRTLILTFTVGFMVGISFVVATSRATTDDRIYEMQKQIVTNTQALVDLKKDVENMKEWRENEIIGTDMVINAKVRVLETTVAEHEKIIWILIAGVIALILKTAGEAILHGQAMKRQQQWQQQQQRKRNHNRDDDSGS